MKKVIFLCLVFCLYAQSNAQTKNLLSGKYSEEQLSKILVPRSDWIPFPKINDREAWTKADQDMLKSYLAKAEEYLVYEWPSLPATKSLLFVRTGNRTEYETISFTKRQVLGTLVLAEIYENKGRFIDQIVNGIWSICEESWWGVPAHLPSGPEYNGLVDVRDPVVDLFSAETASFLAWTEYFLGDRLDSVSPQIPQRIYYETNKRIFEPAMNKPHWWMGGKFGGRPVPNNWNPWICSNWLCTALLLEKNDQKRTAMVYRITQVLDEFVNPYPEDGGCDEGPGYWQAAAGALFDNIAMVNQASNNAFNYVFEDEKIKNMGRYIYQVQISEKYFVNFADAHPKPSMSGSMIYRYGKAIHDTDMMIFGAFYKEKPTGDPSNHFFRNLYNLFIQDELEKTEKRLPLPKDAWLPDIQVMVARDKEGSTDGFFLAAKGGNNAESHNHNDVGNFIVYYDGQPLLIDVGSGTYTRKTFSNERYTIWYNCSDYHNLPTVNGANQLPGSQYRSANVKYQSSENTVNFSLDISKAFPADAEITSLQRHIMYQRGKKITITDRFTLGEAKQISEHFMTVYPAEVIKPGQLVIHYQTEEKSEAKDFMIQYDAKKMNPRIEKIKFKTEEDKGILATWGDRIYRISFDFIAPKQKDQALFTVSGLSGKK